MNDNRREQTVNIPEATISEALAWCFEVDPEAAAQGVADAIRDWEENA